MPATRDPPPARRRRSQEKNRARFAIGGRKTGCFLLFPQTRHMRHISFTTIVALGLLTAAGGASAPTACHLSTTANSRSAASGGTGSKRPRPCAKRSLNTPTWIRRRAPKSSFPIREGGGGGRDPANIDRWLGQFQEPKEQLHHQGEEVTWTVGETQGDLCPGQGTYLKRDYPGLAQDSTSLGLCSDAIRKAHKGACSSA